MIQTTIKLQLRVLDTFMDYLGYHREFVRLGGYTKREFLGNNSVHNISFNDAQKLFNGVTVRVCGNYWDMLDLKHLQIPQDLYQSACSFKLLERTYLQKVKGVGFKVTQNQVKFTKKGIEVYKERWYDLLGDDYSWIKEVL